MGRRLLVIAWIFLSASTGSRLALAQDDGQGPPPPAPVAAPKSEPGDAQSPIPEQLALPPGPVESPLADDPGFSRPQPPKADESGKKTLKSRPAKTAERKQKPSDPPREVEGGFDEIIRKRRTQRYGPVSPPHRRERDSHSGASAPRRTLAGRFLRRIVGRGR